MTAYAVKLQTKNAARCAAVEKAKAAGLIAGECLTITEA